MGRLKDTCGAYAIYASSQFRIVRANVGENSCEMDDDFWLVGMQRTEESLAVSDIPKDPNVRTLLLRFDDVETYDLMTALPGKFDELLREKT